MTDIADFIVSGRVVRLQMVVPGHDDVEVCDVDLSRVCAVVFRNVDSIVCASLYTDTGGFLMHVADNGVFRDAWRRECELRERLAAACAESWSSLWTTKTIIQPAEKPPMIEPKNIELDKSPALAETFPVLDAEKPKSKQFVNLLDKLALAQYAALQELKPAAAVFFLCDPICRSENPNAVLINVVIDGVTEIPHMEFHRRDISASSVDELQRSILVKLAILLGDTIRKLDPKQPLRPKETTP
jgi:hypothetical protein